VPKWSHDHMQTVIPKITQLAMPRLRIFCFKVLCFSLVYFHNNIVIIACYANRGVNRGLVHKYIICIN
jgi:hypothetical protein